LKALPQDQLLHIPPSHEFQLVVQKSDPLPDGTFMRPFPDFTAYYGMGRSDGWGRLCVNHEMHPGGVTFLDIHFDPESQLWDIEASTPADFQPLGNLALNGTARNCSGTITPWGTLVTCEEHMSGTDLNSDGYFDFGWCVELDIKGRRLLDYNGDSRPEKVTAIGRMKHENVAVTPDSSTLYFGAEEATSGFLFKLVLDQKALLDSGALYTLDMDSLGNGYWRNIPNKTVSERNSVLGAAFFAGADNWERIEDVDIDAEGRIYFTSTIRGKVYRFTDMGDSIADFETYIDYGMYPVVTGMDTTYALFQWPDNLAFDDLGNLWITQDGGDNHVWVARAGHSMANPQLEVFMNTPAGSEPTGITFSPDYKFMFMSLQHPWGGNYLHQTDVAGDSMVWNRDATLVIARREFLGAPPTGGGDPVGPGVNLISQFPNPATHVWSLELTSEDTVEASLALHDIQGRLVKEQTMRLLPGLNLMEVDVSDLAPSVYLATLRSGSGTAQLKLVKLN
jgi:secreted PhoX family phosphatase